MSSAHFCQNLTIQCKSGTLEGRLSYREDNAGSPGVILCSPHPLLAGNMDNNVITSLARVLSNYFPVLSFNYRGVGKSFKADPDLPLFEYWNRLDESNDFSSIIADTEQVIEWSKRLFSTFHLVGYSFGSYIGLSALPQKVLSFTAITPPLLEHNFERLVEMHCEILMLFAENDNLLSANNLNVQSGITSLNISGSDHFFIGREEEVSRLVESFVLSEPVKKHP